MSPDHHSHSAHQQDEAQHPVRRQAPQNRAAQATRSDGASIPDGNHAAGAVATNPLDESWALLDGGTVRVPLGTRGQFALIDAADAPDVLRYRWHASKGPVLYARRCFMQRGQPRVVLLHRQILRPVTSSQHIDHINGNGLDNRRRNLRFATPAENQMNRARPSTNRSGYKGVRLHSSGSFTAQILGGRCKPQLHLGSFPTAEDAALVYDVAGGILFGDFCRPNFPGVKHDDDLRQQVIARVQAYQEKFGGLHSQQNGEPKS